MNEPQWRWVHRYAEQFVACAVGAGDVAGVLSETTSRPEVVATARLALETLGASVVDVRVTTPANPGPLPIRSTGASLSLDGNRSVLAALAAADFVADCTVEGLLHAPELGDILRGGARVLMISNEHPENVERWPHDPALADRVAHGVALLEAFTSSDDIEGDGVDFKRRSADAYRKMFWDAGLVGIGMQAYVRWDRAAELDALDVCR